jgi:hypothetical protein
MIGIARVSGSALAGGSPPSRRADRESAIAAKCGDYALKPIGLSLLLNKIHGLLTRGVHNDP